MYLKIPQLYLKTVQLSPPRYSSYRKEPNLPEKPYLLENPFFLINRKNPKNLLHKQVTPSIRNSGYIKRPKKINTTLGTRKITAKECRASLLTFVLAQSTPLAEQKEVRFLNKDKQPFFRKTLLVLKFSPTKSPIVRRNNMGDKRFTGKYIKRIDEPKALVTRIWRIIKSLEARKKRSKSSRLA